VANWRTRDRYGHEIYLTQERWDHIIESHPDLDGRREAVLDTVRKGRREQDVILPYKYTYIRRYDEAVGFNCIVVKVLFRSKMDATGRSQSNNYIVTAWLTFMPSLMR
jgi:hypothetical protein